MRNFLNRYGKLHFIVHTMIFLMSLIVANSVIQLTLINMALIVASSDAPAYAFGEGCPERLRLSSCYDAGVADAQAAAEEKAREDKANDDDDDSNQ